jgi:ferrochelatase
MRYGNPSTEAAIDELIQKGVDDLFIIPLYPHYAMSSYETAVVYLNKILKKKKVSMRTRLLPPFYKDETYISALVESAKPYLENSDFDRLIFSFHGIPERHILKSDTSKSHCFKSKDCCQNCNPAHATCYRHQCTQTVQAFVDKIGLPKEKYFLSFQSRLGRDPWLQPYTDKTIEKHAEDGYKNIKVICPAFTTDCLETLEEIAMEGKEIFEEAGGDHFEHIPCLNENENFIQFLAEKVHAWQNGAYDAVDTKDPVILGTQSFSKI